MKVAKVLLSAAAAVCLASATPAEAFVAKGPPAITSVTLTPATTKGGKVYLTVIGQNVETYTLSARCPRLLYLKYGSRDLCDGVKRVPARRLKKLWLNLKNLNHSSGMIEFTVTVSSPRPTSTPISRTISLVVTE
ncbi:MAG TPA: hypothetical protein VJJ47_01265 [Candidatus Paceibacterota bacterium]